MAAPSSIASSSSATRLDNADDDEANHLHGNHTRRRHVWTHFRNSMEEYLCKSPDKVRELLVCTALYWMGWNSSNLFLQPLMGIRMRPIPYQMTKNGDVLIDLALDNEMIGLDDVQIPSYLLEMISFWLPLTVIALCGYCCSSSSSSPTAIRHDVHSSVCALLLSTGTSEFITQFFKRYIGRLRPNFYSMCQFHRETQTCMAPMEQQVESRMSFPSGHSSLSFCGMTLLSLVLAGKVAIASGKGKGRKVRYLLSFSPLLLSSLVASSRLVDNWHHPSDVVAGSCLGTVCALLCYHMWYPSIWSPQAGVPLSLVTTTTSSDASEVDAEMGSLLPPPPAPPSSSSPSTTP